MEFIVRVKGDVTDDMMDVVTAQCWAMGIILVLPIFHDRQDFCPKHCEDLKLYIDSF